MNPGNVTWSQIPVMTKMACGAREATTYGEGRNLRFKVGGRMRYVEVELTPADTYTARLVRINARYERVVVEEKTDVYCDMLSETVYRLCNK